MEHQTQPREDAFVEPDEKLLDHNYDGIQELDNPLPRWWVYLFYITIAFAIGYFIYYTFGYGDSLDDSYTKRKQSMEKKQGVTQPLAFVVDSDTIQQGKTLYSSHCAACHGRNGEGVVGPNLTDRYWIHGHATNQDIYDVISEGVPEKGMLAWKTMLKPTDIQSLVVYIQSIKESNPPHAKGPEGDLIER